MHFRRPGTIYGIVIHGFRLKKSVLDFTFIKIGVITGAPVSCKIVVNCDPYLKTRVSCVVQISDQFLKYVNRRATFKHSC